MPIGRMPKARKAIKAMKETKAAKPKRLPKADFDANVDLDDGPPVIEESLLFMPKFMAAVSGEPLPSWAVHFIDALDTHLMRLMGRIGGDTGYIQVINIWADCCGKGTEIFAGDLIQEALQQKYARAFRVNLYMAVDNDKFCRQMVNMNHHPTHVSADIFHRDFANGTVTTVDAGVIPFPLRGAVDVYVCCFPCGPWSLLGKKLGFSDKNGAVVWQAIKTVKMLQPSLFFFENVMQIASSSQENGESDLTTIKTFMHSQLENYSHGALIGIDPPFAGSPTHKNRVLLVGGRLDQLFERDVMIGFDIMVANPYPSVMDYRSLLGLSQVEFNHWDRVGELPNADESVRLMAMKCSCAFDPYKACDAHPCKCAACKREAKRFAAHPTAAPLHSTCQWRVRANNYIITHFDENVVDRMADKLLYTQVLELYVGPGPNAARERNLLNISALLPGCHPLKSSFAVIDLAPSIGLSGFKTDGSVPTMPVNATMWVMRDGRRLTVPEVAKLMGHDPIKIQTNGLSDTQLKKMFGMALHVSTAGTNMFDFMFNLIRRLLAFLNFSWIFRVTGTN